MTPNFVKRMSKKHLRIWCNDATGWISVFLVLQVSFIVYFDLYNIIGILSVVATLVVKLIVMSIIRKWANRFILDNNGQGLIVIRRHTRTKPSLSYMLTIIEDYKVQESFIIVKGMIAETNSLNKEVLGSHPTTIKKTLIIPKIYNMDIVIPKLEIAKSVHKYNIQSRQEVMKNAIYRNTSASGR